MFNAELSQRGATFEVLAGVFYFCHIKWPKLIKLANTYITARLAPKNMSVCKTKNKNDEFQENVAEK